MVAERDAGTADVQFAGHAGGTGCIAGVEHVSRVLAIGRPMTMSPAPASRARRSTRRSFRSGRTCSTARRARRAGLGQFRGSASPPHSAFSSGPPRQPASSSIARWRAWPASWWRRGVAAGARSAAAVGGLLASDEHDFRPRRSVAASSSSTAMSNDSVVTAPARRRRRVPGARRIASRKLTTARCGTRTPLGRPVEPEV